MQGTLSGVWLPNYSSDCITCPVPLSALCTGKCICPDSPLSFNLCTQFTCISDQRGRGTVTDHIFKLVKWVKGSVQTKKLDSMELYLLWRLTCTFPKAPIMNKICFFLLFADFLAFLVFDQITHKCCLCCNSFHLRWVSQSLNQKGREGHWL